MDPYGHHNRPIQTHHHHRDEREDDYPPPPQAPPYYAPPPPHQQPHFPGDGGYPSPPPPPQHHSTNVYHTSHVPGGGLDYPPPPPRPHAPDYYAPPPPPQPHGFNYSDSPSYAPPPPHVSHNPPPSFGRVEVINEPHHRPHVPSITHGHNKEGSYLESKPPVRVYSKAETNYSLTIRDGKVILARSNPSDPFQHWVKDEKYSIRVKDEEGFPSFALVNKATGLAMKHSIGATHPVQVTPYNPDVLDESVLWTESKDLGDSYRTIRMVNNIRLNVDAFNGDKNHGGVRDGTTIVLWEWKKGENQRWKIVPY